MVESTRRLTVNIYIYGNIFILVPPSSKGGTIVTRKLLSLATFTSRDSGGSGAAVEAEVKPVLQPGAMHEYI
jgi:hypothetical protein